MLKLTEIYNLIKEEKASKESICDEVLKSKEFDLLPYTLKRIYKSWSNSGFESKYLRPITNYLTTQFNETTANKIRQILKTTEIINADFEEF